MPAVTVEFDGYEIDRVIEFVDILYPKFGDRDAKPKASINRSICEATATLLVGDDEAKAKVRHTFEQPPSGDRPDYQRTLTFRAGGRVFEFGGVNAIREEWRLEKIHFEVVTDETPVEENYVRQLLDSLFPSKGKPSPSEAHFNSALKQVRLILMKVIPCANYRATQRLVRAKLERVIGQTNRNTDGWVAAGFAALLGDLGDPGLARENATALRVHGALRGADSPGLLRQLCRDHELPRDGALTRLVKEMLETASEHLEAELRKTASGAPSAIEEALRECWTILEAVSFATRISHDLHDVVARLVVRLAEIEKKEIRDLKGAPGASALSAAMLAYATLYRSHGGEAPFSTSVETIRPILIESMSRNGHDRTDANHRISAMVALAQTNRAVEDDIQEGFSEIAATMRAAEARRRRAAREVDAELAAGADACGYLFTLRSAQGANRIPKGELEVFELIAELWQRTPTVAVRRSCARNIFEGLWSGVPAHALTRGAGGIKSGLGRFGRRALRVMGLGKPAGSLHHARRFPKVVLPIDLPSQALLLALDDWALLERLSWSDEYIDHPDCTNLSNALLAFAEAETDYVKGDLDRALIKFDNAIDLTRKLSAPFIAPQVVSRLAAGIGLRASCCRANRRDTQPREHTIEASATAATVMWEDMQSLAHESDPDYWMAQAFMRLFRGVLGSRFWEGGDAWTPTLVNDFRAAHNLSQRSGSPTFEQFCVRYIRPILPNALFQRTAESGEVAAQIPLGELSGGMASPVAPTTEAGVILGMAGIRRVIEARSQASRNLRVEQLVAGMSEYRLRPIGIIAIGQALQW